MTFWDSGELIYSAVTLGLAHPPAYPVFTILGKAMSLLPFGNAAYRVNLLSALFGSLTVYVLYRLTREMTGRVPAGTPVSVSAALLYAFTVPFWSQAVVTEVYTVNAFALACIAFFLFRYDADGRVAHLHASAFALGLAMVAHQSAVFLLPAYAAYYVYRGGLIKEPKRIVVSGFFALLGYSAVLYLPLRAISGTPMNIGAPDTLPQLAWVLRIHYHVKTLAAVPNRLVKILSGDLLLPLLAAAVLLAVLAWAFRKRAYPLFLIAASASYYAGNMILTAYALDIKKWGLDVKLNIPVLLFAIPFAASLIGAALSGGGANAKARRAGAPAVFAWLLLALPAAALYHGWHGCDNSRNFFAAEFAANTLKSVKANGALFAWGDNGVFPVWYIQGHERYRDDVLFMHTELLTYPWYMSGVVRDIYGRYGVVVRPPRNLRRLDRYVPILKFILEKRTPTYFDYSAATMLKIEMGKLKPQGLVHQVGSQKADRLGAVWERYSLRGAFDGSTNPAFAAEGILSIYGFEAGIWAQEAYAAGRPREALRAYALARKLGAGDRLMDTWAEQIRRQLGESENN